ncbi:MAG: YitT family protein [Clostridia bacterium]|nr:YitT family protein [Clostridia bacterium]
MKESNKFIQMILLVLGTLILAIAINLLFLPNNLSTGGASGIALIIYYLYKVPVGLTVILINIPLFIIALKDLGWKFCSKAIIGTVLLSAFIELTSRIVNIVNIEQDLFLGCIFGGLLNGIGLSLVFKADGSTGGSDLLAQIIYKKRPVSSIGQILLVIDSLVIITNAIVFNSISIALYSVIALFISKKTTDIIFEGVNYTKAVNIISKEGDKIAKEIIEKTDRGVTTSKCIGVYTNEEYTHVISVVTVPQLPAVKKIVKSIDKGAFIYISDTREVLGLGFKQNV